MTFDELLEIAPYSLAKEEKEPLLTKRLKNLTLFHRDHCLEYARILDSIGFAPEQVKSYRDLPFLPVRMFKDLELLSVPREAVVKAMTSSGGN